MHEPCIAEQRDCELPVVPAIDSSGQDLVYEIVDDAVQEVVPGELEEQIL